MPSSLRLRRQGLPDVVREADAGWHSHAVAEEATMETTDDDRPSVPRIIPPVWELLWLGAQFGMTVQAGGRRRFPGQTALAATIGAAALALSVGALGRFRRAGTTMEPNRPQAASALVTDGLYAHTRNPMYCAILLILLAHAVWQGRRLRTLVALPGLVLTLQSQITAEEHALTRLFGADYEAYRARVPRWF